MSQLTDLQERLALYRAAEAVILQTGQAVTIGSQRYDRANLGLIQAEIKRLEQQIGMLSAGGSGPRLSHSQAVFGGRR